MNIKSICPNTGIIIGIWKQIPGYKKKGKFIRYDVTYYCNKSKIIHSNKKEYLNCKFCKTQSLTKN